MHVVNMEFDKKETASYLDGVPFTVGQKFCPPRAVSLPYCISYQLPSELMSDEYEFSLECKVLAFCKAKEEAEKRQEEAEKQQAEQRLQDEAAASKALEASLPESNGSSVTHGMKPSTSMWNPDTILQPQSQLPNSSFNGSSVDGAESLKKINFSDFEIDTRSPFDYMELQTINDLEELSTVFQDFGKDQKVNTAQSVENVHAGSSISNEQQVEENRLALNENFKVPGNENSAQACINGLSLAEYTLPTFNSFSKNNSGYLSFSSSAVEQLPPDGSKRNGDSFNVSGYNVLSQVPCIRTLTGHTTTSTSSVHTPSASSNPLRSSKSISDLTNILPANNDYSYSKRSSTPPAKAYEMPSHEFEESITFVKQPFDKNSNAALGQSKDLSDPYEELSNNERHIVDSIADMGFHRGLVSRTVKHLGTDEKKVVEHLCQIQALEESGYDKFEAETALHLHDYDKNEAVKYLDLINQFQDLGFEKEAIKKALVTHKNDRDKVIDMLLS